MVEHSSAKIGLHLDSGAEKADSPQKAAYYHYDDNTEQRLADVIKQKIHIEQM
jgi:hypothetical protein